MASIKQFDYAADRGVTSTLSPFTDSLPFSVYSSIPLHSIQESAQCLPCLLDGSSSAILKEQVKSLAQVFSDAAKSVNQDFITVPDIPPIPSLIPDTAIENLQIRSLGPQDDDLRVKINGVIVSDTRLNVGWYFGANQTFFPNGLGGGTGTKNNAFATQGFRIINLDPKSVSTGDLIEIDTFDGWGVGWRTSPWEMNVKYFGYPMFTLSGGTASNGPSPQQPPFPGTYFNIGPHFFNYYPNGSIIIPPP